MPVFVVDHEHAIAGAQPPEVLAGLLDVAHAGPAGRRAPPAPKRTPAPPPAEAMRCRRAGPQNRAGSAVLRRLRRRARDALPGLFLRRRRLRASAGLTAIATASV